MLAVYQQIKSKDKLLIKDYYMISMLETKLYDEGLIRRCDLSSRNRSLLEYYESRCGKRNVKFKNFELNG